MLRRLEPSDSLRLSLEPPSSPSPQSRPSIPVANMDRATAIDVHQPSDEDWTLELISTVPARNRPPLVCQRCHNTDCQAARCPLCGEETATPVTSLILVTCPGTMGVRLPLPAVGKILPTLKEIRLSNV